MNTPSLSPIPIPASERLRHARMRLVPVAVFAAAVVTLGMLWKNHVGGPTATGQAEAVVAQVSSHKPGVLAGLNVARFQRVRAGDPLGQILIADPKLVESSLAVLRAEIEMIRLNLSPIVRQQRNAVDYFQLRLDWMRQRATLASTRVNLQFAEAELRRNEDLFKQKIISESLVDQARTTRDALQREVEELEKLVAEGEQNFRDLNPGNASDISKISDDPMRAAIALQEAKLRQTEAELSPVLLRSPIDGVVTSIFHRSGESVTAGQPVVAISTLNSTRVVGYLRQPLTLDPKPGMTVQVRARSGRRETGEARVVQVGTQLEALPAALQSPIKLATAELALPVDISVPANLNLRPGEVVDITFLQGRSSEGILKE